MKRTSVEPVERFSDIMNLRQAIADLCEGARENNERQQ